MSEAIVGLTAAQVTNLYLYGQITKPSDLTSTAFIRSADTIKKNVIVDAQDYMTNGPGRFASPAFFDIIQRFFLMLVQGFLKIEVIQKQN